MKTDLLVLAAAATLAMHVPAQAQSGGSLNDARSAITKGTAPGIVIIGAKRRAPEPSTAASEARKGDAAAPATVSAPLAERVGAALKWGDPPSGQPLNAARRLDSPTLGIPLPSVRPAASQPTAK